MLTNKFLLHESSIRMSSSSENLKMQIIAESSASTQKSSNVQFIGDSPITDPGTKVSWNITSIKICLFKKKFHLLF